MIRLACPKARRIERLVGHGAEVVCGEEMVTARTANGHFGVGHRGTDAGRERALDFLLARETERAERDAVELQLWAAGDARNARMWAACQDLEAAVRLQLESGAIYAEARRLYEALYEALFGAGEVAS